MSRCFPYPPPGCSRNRATYEALIESIKLQKENDKAKAERKKEKRVKKEKKEKGKRKGEEKSKAKEKNPNEYQHDAHKVLEGSVDFKEGHNKKTEPTIEQLERSDLTEEHGQPIISHKRSYSSDSTQNSSKRKREDTILPDGSSGHGKPIKIRLLKKQRPESNKEALCSNSGRTDPKGLSGADLRVGTWNVSTSGNTGPLVSSNRYSGAPATSGRENSAGHVIPFSQTKSTSKFVRPGIKKSDTQGLKYGRQQLVPGSALKEEAQASNLNKSEVTVPSRFPKSDVKWHAIPIHGRPIQSHMEHQMLTPSSIMPPAPSVSRKIDIQGYISGIEHSTLSFRSPVLPSNHLIHEVPNWDSTKTKPSAMGKRQMSEINNSGVMRLKKKREDLIGDVPVAGTINGQKGGLSRSEKKRRKKHAKYEKLIGSWAPRVLQALSLEADNDEDWLSRSGRTGKCSSRTDVETCRDSAASLLWQPCARFLVDADLHALPYTVPF